MNAENLSDEDIRIIASRYNVGPDVSKKKYKYLR